MENLRQAGCEYTLLTIVLLLYLHVKIFQYATHFPVTFLPFSVGFACRSFVALNNQALHNGVSFVDESSIA